jgi:hypothetical protein
MCFFVAENAPIGFECALFVHINMSVLALTCGRVTDGIFGVVFFFTLRGFLGLNVFKQLGDVVDIQIVKTESYFNTLTSVAFATRCSVSVRHTFFIPVRVSELNRRTGSG